MPGGIKSPQKACSGTIGGVTFSPNLDWIPSEQCRASAEPAMQLASAVDATGKKNHRPEGSVEWRRFSKRIDK